MINHQLSKVTAGPLLCNNLHSVLENYITCIFAADNAVINFCAADRNFKYNLKPIKNS